MLVMGADVVGTVVLVDALGTAGAELLDGSEPFVPDDVLPEGLPGLLLFTLPARSGEELAAELAVPGGLGVGEAEEGAAAEGSWEPVALARTWPGVKEGPPLVPATFVAPKIQASTLPGFGR